MANLLPRRAPSKHRHASHSSALSLILDVHDNARSIIKPVTNALLDIDVAVAAPPDHLNLKFYWIHPRVYENGQYYRYSDEGRIVSHNQNGEYVAQGPDEVAYNPSIVHMKHLIKLMSNKSRRTWTSMMIYASYMHEVDENFKGRFTTQLLMFRATVADITIDEFLFLFNEFAHCRPFDIQGLAQAGPSHFTYFLALAANFIGKLMTSQNFSEWLLRRRRSYAAPLGLSEEDNILVRFGPSPEFAIGLNSDCKMYWRLRRSIFSEVYALADSNCLIACGMRITRSLLQNAEMTNISMIVVWLVTLNPEVLMWNEIAKYLPYICAAYAKYQTLKHLAPWAKLILPMDETAEFANSKLQIPYTVARAISNKYGNGSVQNLAGQSNLFIMEDIVRHALDIVATSGGAKTVDIMTLRNWRFNGYENRELFKLLDTGAEDIKEDELPAAEDAEARNRDVA